MFASASKRLLTRYTVTAARQLTASATRRNVIQDLYLKELKSVKVAPISAESAEGSVRPWIEPKQAKVPELELSGTAEALEAYEKQEVETVEAAAEEAADFEEGDWLVLDEAEEEHHGH